MNRNVFDIVRTWQERGYDAVRTLQMDFLFKQHVLVTFIDILERSRTQ